MGSTRQFCSARQLFRSIVDAFRFWIRRRLVDLRVGSKWVPRRGVPASVVGAWQLEERRCNKQYPPEECIGLLVGGAPKLPRKILKYMKLSKTLFERDFLCGVWLSDSPRGMKVMKDEYGLRSLLILQDLIRNLTKTSCKILQDLRRS